MKIYHFVQLLGELTTLESLTSEIEHAIECNQDAKVNKKLRTFGMDFSSNVGEFLRIQPDEHILDTLGM